jgi:hypothetical protein
MDEMIGSLLRAIDDSAFLSFSLSPRRGSWPLAPLRAAPLILLVAAPPAGAAKAATSGGRRVSFELCAPSHRL